ncbi:GNAT family N-acetyltransferase [Aeromicrobium erythreum]|nr:GNAT family N-acetyltransferase [Aeromicrobium erythreum]
MTFTHRPLDPVADLDLVHGWVTQERAEFWGMTDYTREEVGEVYAYLDSLSTHHAYLVLELPGEGAGTPECGVPVAIFQTYEPRHDPVGEAYPVREGDLGVHLFVGPGEPRSGFTGSLVAYVLRVLLADPAVRRLVVEPDVRNERSVSRFLREGFERGPVVDLGHKTAQLAFLPRPT